MGYRAGDVNLYRFVGNDPANNTDPSGLQGIPASTLDTIPPPRLPIRPQIGSAMSGGIGGEERPSLSLFLRRILRGDIYSPLEAIRFIANDLPLSLNPFELAILLQIHEADRGQKLPGYDLVQAVVYAKIQAMYADAFWNQPLSAFGGQSHAVPGKMSCGFATGAPPAPFVSPAPLKKLIADLTAGFSSDEYGKRAAALKAVKALLDQAIKQRDRAAFHAIRAELFALLDPKNKNENEVQNLLGEALSYQSALAATGGVPPEVVNALILRFPALVAADLPFSRLLTGIP